MSRAGDAREYADMIAEALQEQGALTIEDIVEIIGGRALRATPESLREDAEAVYYRRVRLPDVNAELRERKEFAMATLARRSYFTQFRAKEVPVTPEDAVRLFAGSGPGTGAAGIVVNDPALFNASRERNVLSGNGKMRRSADDSIHAVAAKGATPADMYPTAAALQDAAKKLNEPRVARLIDRAVSAHEKLEAGKDG